MSDHDGHESHTPDPIPLLPRGDLLFEAIPLRAVVMEPLAPALGSGTMIVRDHDRGAAVLVRGGALVEVHAFSGSGESRSGEGVAAEVQGWEQATITASRLDPMLVDVCEALLRGEVMYTDLRLDWVDWPALLADFGRRGGAYAVEMFTSAGRGVTCVAMGKQALSYTDIHPALGDPELLEAMAATREGSLRVRRLNAASFAATLASASHAAPEPREEVNGSDEGSAVAVHEPERGGEPPVRAAHDEMLSDLSWVAPWQTRWRDDAAAERPASAPASTTSDAPAVGDILGDLRVIARRRLQLSASRVEAILDEAAREGRSLASVLDEVRAMSIRGVMPATVASMVEEMSAAAAHRPA